jgi:hypothetical protein
MEKTKSYQRRARLRLSRSPEFYRKFVAGFRSSGLTLSQYCQKHNVGESSFRKYHKQAVPHKAAPSKSPSLVRIVGDIAPPHRAPTVEILLPGGAVIRLLELNRATLDALRPLLVGNDAAC